MASFSRSTRLDSSPVRRSTLFWCSRCFDGPKRLVIPLSNSFQLNPIPAKPHMSDVTIYHNPACGTSRNTLALIRNAGLEPAVIEYLKTPPSEERLLKLIKDMGISPRELLRQKGTPYDELRLGEPSWTDAQLVAFMLAHPILINRPIVVTPKGTRLCRPSEMVLDILPSAQRGSFAKEDGEVVIDTNGKRV